MTPYNVQDGQLNYLITAADGSTRPTSVPDSAEARWYLDWSVRAPLAHQVRDFIRFKDGQRVPALGLVPHFALFYEQRARKTKVALDVFRYRYEQGDVDALFVIAYPSGVPPVWLDEIQKDFPPEFLAQTKAINWRSVSASSKAGKELLFSLRPHPGPIVVTMNCEALGRSKKAWDYLEWLLKRRRAMVVADECFISGTLINTPFGGVPIECLKPGDLVITPSGVGKIFKTIERRSKKITYLLAGQEVILGVTPNHPLFTEVGWVCSAATEGRWLLDEQTILRLVRGNDTGRPNLLFPLMRNESGTKTSVAFEGTQREKDITQLRILSQGIFDIAKEQKEILQSILFDELALERTAISCKDFGSLKKSGIIRENSNNPRPHSLEQRNSYARGDEEKIERYSQSKRANLENTWWERAYAAGASAKFAERLGSAMDTGISHPVGRKPTWLSNLLQSGLSLSGSEISHRGRWFEPQQFTCQSDRREERYQTSGIRVDRVENIELESPISVFDLQLEGDPRYFANGVLVHNSAWAASWTAQTQKLLTLGRRPSVVVKAILDGTPVSEGPGEIWYPTKFLHPQLLGFADKEAFQARYFEYEEEEVPETRPVIQPCGNCGGLGGNCFICTGTGSVVAQVPTGVIIRNRVKRDRHDPKTGKVVQSYDVFKGYRNCDELEVRLKAFGSRVLRSDVSDAPAKTYTPVYFDLTPSQRRVYDDLRDRYVAELSGGQVRAANVLLRMTRLQMVARNYYPPEREGVACERCSGEGWFVDEGREVECPTCDGLGVIVRVTELRRIDPDRNPAIEALTERLLQERRAPAVIWCRFKQDVRDVLAATAALGLSYFRYDGDVREAQREADYQAFRRGEGDGIAATVGSGLQRGKDLSRAGLLIYYSNDFSLRKRQQSEDRAESLDRLTPTDVLDLIANDTRDGEVVAALRDKRSLAELIMGDPPQKWL